MIRILKYILFPVLFLILSCEDVVPVKDNPLDPDGGDYEVPLVAFISDITDGEIITSEVLTLSWEGNELVTEFRYKLDTFAWTDWSEDASATLEYLDEGEHYISIQSRYVSGDTSEVISLSFVVDAVEGPALMFYPRRHLSEVGNTVTFQILAEEVTNLMAAEIHLVYDPAKLEVISVNQGSLFQNGQESIFSYDVGSGAVEILTTLLNADAPSVSGTGDLIELQVKLLQDGSADITFNGSDVFRDPDNNDIAILEKINGLVATE